MGGEAIHGVFAPQLLSSFDIEGGEMNLRVVSSERREATLAFAFLGASLGLALGLAGGRGRTRLTGASAGLVLGTVAGGGVAWALLAIYYRNVNRDVDELILPLLIHGGIWGAIGAVGGLAFGIGRGERRGVLPAILGGLLGALAATFIYDVVGGLAFPLAKTAEPLSESWATRLLARLLVACCTAVGVGFGVRGARPNPTSAPEVA
jgi:outer membrane lipoprotein SlyB